MYKRNHEESINMPPVHTTFGAMRNPHTHTNIQHFSHLNDPLIHPGRITAPLSRNQKIRFYPGMPKRAWRGVDPNRRI